MDEEDIIPPKKKQKSKSPVYGEANFDFELSKYTEFSSNIKKRQKVIKSILSQYKEFAHIDPQSIEANLLVQAICQMGSNKAGASARKYVDEKARLHGPSQSSQKIVISFWDPVDDPIKPLEEDKDANE